jgi:hypothetical protein
VTGFRQVEGRGCQLTTAASGAMCVPAACPIEESDTETHGHSGGHPRSDGLGKRWPGKVSSQPSKLVIASSSLLDDLGRVRRVQAKPLREPGHGGHGPRGWQLREGRGGAGYVGRVWAGQYKIGVQLARVTSGPSRTLQVAATCRSRV